MSSLREYPRKAETLSLDLIVKSMGKHTDYNPFEITRMLCMCYDLGKTKEYLLAPSIRDFIFGVQLEIYGHGQKINPHIELPNVNFHQTAEILRDHYTLIEINKQPIFLWYEPDHDLDKERYFLRIFHMGKSNAPFNGGFLVQIDQDPGEIKELYDGFKSLELLEPCDVIK